MQATATTRAAADQIVALNAQAEREVEAIKTSLGVEIKAIIGVMLSAHEVLSGLRGRPQASSVKIATELPEPAVYRATADRIGLLGEMAPAVTSFYVALDRISIAVRVVTDPPPPRSDISVEPSTYILSPEDLRKITGLFEQACRQSLSLLSALPPGDGDDELRAKIVSLKPLSQPA